MNRILKTVLVLTIFFITGRNLITAQPDTTEQNEEELYKFAKFLKIEKEYKFATQEFERLNYLYPNKRNYTKELIHCARLSGEFARIASRFKIESSTPKDIIIEYSLGMIGIEKTSEALNLIENNGILNDDKLGEKGRKIIYATNLLDSKIPSDTMLTSDKILTGLRSEYVQMLSKSPFKAGLFSTLVPGSGRFYTKDWKNGILSFLFIAGTGWQSYSRFKKNGASSAGGWIYGGLSLGFYLGNIYGSVFSAKKYNLTQKNRIDEKALRYISNLSF